MLVRLLLRAKLTQHQRKDYYLLFSEISLVMAVFFILFNLLSDLALAALDPRARRGGAGEAA